MILEITKIQKKVQNSLASNIKKNLMIQIGHLFGNFQRWQCLNAVLASRLKYHKTLEVLTHSEAIINKHLPMVMRVNPPVAVDRYPDHHEQATVRAAMQLDAQTVTNSDCTWYLQEKWSPATAMLRLVQSLESALIPNACESIILFSDLFILFLFY